jgi:hypothetical protein
MALCGYSAYDVLLQLVRVGIQMKAVAAITMPRRLAFLVAVLASLLVGCDVDRDRDIRERTYETEIACDGFLQKDNRGAYKCDDKLVDLKKNSNYTNHTVKVNRRAGSVAFDGRPLDDCRVVDFDEWECVLKLGVVGKSRIVNPYRGHQYGGYVQSICSVDINTSEEECEKRRYFGLYLSDDSTFGRFMGLFCRDDTLDHAICKFLQKL